MNRDLNDDLSDLLGGETAPLTSIKQPPASYAPLEQTVFAEGCPKCRGTGSFISYSGRNLGPCFACKGAGKNVYKTSPEARAKSRANAAARKVSKEQQIAADAKAFIDAHEAEIKWLTIAGQRNIERNGTFTFPQDLLTKLWQYGSLTDSQLAAVQRLMAKDEARSAERTAAAPAADVSALEKAFAVARERAMLPGAKGVFTKPLKLTSGSVSVAISSPKPGSKWDGMLFVRDAKDDERKLGYFKGGKFFRQGAATDAEAAAILTVAASPFDAVKAYAKAWSECGICGKTLFNAESIERGIGPICAAKYGWGF
jgi:hypothetical protein